MESSALLQIARDAIVSAFEGTAINKAFLIEKYPMLSHSRATFVTLTEGGKLRGCIGSLVAHRSLLEDVIENAQSAAFRDPRFPPLSREELNRIRIEVSLLTQPQSIEYKNAEELSRIIRPGVDGVILRLGNRQATFLPQVWDELSNFEAFFAHLGLKAGIDTNPLQHHPDIYTYQVEKYQESA